MSKTCVYECNHYADYLAWDDDAQTELEVCACCYGEPYSVFTRS